MAEVKHTPLFIRDYGQPVELAAAECQFALLDAPDGAPVAYVYVPEDAAMFAAAPDLAQDGGFLLERLDEFVGELKDDAVARQFYGHVSPAVARFAAALSKATAQQEGR